MCIDPISLQLVGLFYNYQSSLIFSKYFLNIFSTRKGVKYTFKVRFRSFKSLNIKMSHSVAQKNHLPSEFMSIYSWVKAKLLFFIFVKHPVERERERDKIWEHLFDTEKLWTNVEKRFEASIKRFHPEPQMRLSWAMLQNDIYIYIYTHTHTYMYKREVFLTHSCFNT